MRSFTVIFIAFLLNSTMVFAGSPYMATGMKIGEVTDTGAIVWVERDGQKQIVIGKGGNVLKKVGTEARLALQELLDEKVFLQLFVKVSRDWSDNERALKQFGYDD